MNKNFKIKNNLVLSEPSDWIKENLTKNINDLTLLDIACGNGRHSIYASSIGYNVISLDISREKISILASKKSIFPVQIDIEKKIRGLLQIKHLMQ